VTYTLIQAPSAFLVDIGFDLSQVGYALGVPQTISGLIGACVAAVIVNWQGLKKTAWILIWITLAGISGMLLLSTLPNPSLQTLTAIIFVWGFASPFFLVLLITALYRWTCLTQTATDYTIMASAAFLGISLAPALYGLVAGALDWTSFYIIMGLMVFAVGYAFIRFYDRIDELVNIRNAAKKDVAVNAT
ncbi:MAG: MFS transporter, partial [Pseudomonadota bacterium]